MTHHPSFAMCWVSPGFRVRFSVRVKARVNVRVLFGIRVKFPLSVQWRTGRYLSVSISVFTVFVE